MWLGSQHYYPCLEKDDQVAGIANADFSIHLQPERGWVVPALDLRGNAVTRTELTTTAAAAAAVAATILLSDMVETGARQGSVEDRPVFGGYMDRG